MIVADDDAYIDFDVVADDDHYRAAVSYEVSTMVLFGRNLNSAHITVSR